MGSVLENSCCPDAGPVDPRYVLTGLRDGKCLLLQKKQSICILLMLKKYFKLP